MHTHTFHIFNKQLSDPYLRCNILTNTRVLSQFGGFNQHWVNSFVESFKVTLSLFSFLRCPSSPHPDTRGSDSFSPEWVWVWVWVDKEGSHLFMSHFNPNSPNFYFIFMHKTDILYIQVQHTSTQPFSLIAHLFTTHSCLPAYSDQLWPSRKSHLWPHSGQRFQPERCGQLHLQSGLRNGGTHTCSLSGKPPVEPPASNM